MITCHECTCFQSPPCNACVLCSHIDVDEPTRADCDYTCATCPYPCDEHPEVVLAGMTPETHPQGDATPMVECPDCHGSTGPSMMTYGSGLTFDQCGKCDGIGKIPDFGTYRNPAEVILEGMTKVIEGNRDMDITSKSIAMQLMQFVTIPEVKPNPPVTPHFYIHTGGRIEQAIATRGSFRPGVNYPLPSVPPDGTY